MISFLYRYLLLPGFETLYKRRKIFRYWKELESSQWRDPQELDRIQFQALRRLLTHAYTNCPYYRLQWEKKGLHPDGVKDTDDFHAWPLLSREDIQVNRKAMRGTIPGLRLMSKSTGGSSGIPLQFDLDADSNDRRVAASYRGYNWAGAGPGTKQLYLWGVPLGTSSRWHHWKDALYNRLQRRLVLNSFKLSEKTVPDFLDQINSYRPEIIVAYTNPLFSLAQALEERAKEPFSPRAIVVGAEKLYPFQRVLIERVFRTPVFETYGSREFMLVGAECERHEGLHLTQEQLLVEIVDDNGKPTTDGEEGNVIVTDLYNYGMPFIRYMTGDRAIAGWERCSCGRGLPLLRQVVGRRLDILYTPDGRRIPGEFFPHLIKDFPTVKRFQVVQLEPTRIELRAVLGDGWSETDHLGLMNAIREVIGPTVHFEILPVKDIPLTPVGKLQVVINHCQSNNSLFSVK